MISEQCADSYRGGTGAQDRRGARRRAAGKVGEASWTWGHLRFVSEEGDKSRKKESVPWGHCEQALFCQVSGMLDLLRDDGV